MTELVVEGLSKRLGDHLAVDDVSFTVADGEFFVLLGSSGSGKTTTLRMLCGLERPDAGRIVLSGREIDGLPPRERNLGMVFQEYGLYPAMDVRGNIAYGLEARGGLGKDEIESRIVAAASKLGLADLLSQSTQQLSGGEQQRVALARAMVKDADAYLFDEPLSNLDPTLRHRARRDIKAVHLAKGRPSVYVTHDQSEAFALADRVGVMAGGRLVQVGTPDELIGRPANVFVARFIGTPPMNVVRRDDVLVGVRPEDLRLVTGSGLFTGKVVDVEEGLVDLLVRVELEGDGTTVVAALDDGEPAPGDTVTLDADPDDLHRFDIETEQAIPRA